MKLKFLLLPFLMSFTLCFNGLSQDSWKKVEIITNNIDKNIKMLNGQGGNIGVIIGEKEILVIDAQFEPLYPKIKKAIESISDLPVTYLFNTHWHGDHTGGNNKFNEDGALLIAHENVKERMSTPQKIAHFGREVPASELEAQPEITFDTNLKLDLGNQQVHFIHLKSAHTDGDAIVYLPKSNVIHMGDIYFAGMYPFVDLSSGGNVQGVIEACEEVLTLCNDSTIVIPGHGPLSNQKELIGYTFMLKDLVLKVTKAKTEGRGLKEINADELTKSYKEFYGAGFIQSKDIISFIYNGLSD